jgi:hypothetical protein
VEAGRDGDEGGIDFTEKVAHVRGDGSLEPVRQIGEPGVLKVAVTEMRDLEIGKRGQGGDVILLGYRTAAH